MKKRILTAVLVATVGLTLSACSAPRETTEAPDRPLAVGDCYIDDVDAYAVVGCDGDHDMVVFALPETTSTTDSGIRDDADEKCKDLADPDRLEEVIWFGPMEEDVEKGDGTITCLYDLREAEAD